MSSTTSPPRHLATSPAPTSPPRHLAPALRAANGSFEASSRGRLRPGAIPALASQRSHRDQNSLEKLISQCQAAERNNAVVRAIIGAKSAMIVGDGPSLKARSDDAGWNNDIERRFEDWCATWADASGVMTFDQLVAACPPMWDTDGGALFHKIEASGAEPGRLECIELARLCNPAGKPDSELTRAGITTDARGRPVTFHVAPWRDYGSLNKAAVVDVDADEMLYLPPPRGLKPGQLRSEPLLASLLPELEFLKDSAHAVHTAFIMAAQAALVIALGDPTQNLPDTLAQALVDAREATNTTEAKDAGEWRAGAVLHLGLGESASQIKPEHPTQQYTDFYKEQLRVACAALGIPMSCVLYLFDRSYSASRAELAVMGRHISPVRWFLESRLLVPVYRFFVAGEIRNGRVAKVNGWDRCAWTWPALPVLDPKIEIEARANQVAAGLGTRELALRELGVEMEVEEFFRQRSAELVIEREMGIVTAKPAQESRTVMQEGTGD